MELTGFRTGRTGLFGPGGAARVTRSDDAYGAEAGTSRRRSPRRTKRMR